MHSVRLDTTKLILIDTRTTYLATGNAGYEIYYIYQIDQIDQII